jgi:hypothetical protein
MDQCLEDSNDKLNMASVRRSERDSLKDFARLHQIVIISDDSTEKGVNAPRPVWKRPGLR